MFPIHSEAAKKKLMHAFFRFIGVTMFSSSTTSDCKFNGDVFLHTELLHTECLEALVPPKRSYQIEALIDEYGGEAMSFPLQTHLAAHDEIVNYVAKTPDNMDLNIFK